MSKIRVSMLPRLDLVGDVDAVVVGRQRGAGTSCSTSRVPDPPAAVGAQVPVVRL